MRRTRSTRLQHGATFQSAYIDGGPGDNTFIGDPSGVTAVNFETYINNGPPAA